MEEILQEKTGINQQRMEQWEIEEMEGKESVEAESFTVSSF